MREALESKDVAPFWDVFPTVLFLKGQKKARMEVKYSRYFQETKINALFVVVFSLSKHRTLLW